MRTEKFDSTKDAFDNDDIVYAFQCNSLGDRLKDIDVIVAEVCGENDGYPWYWILQMKDGSFSWATGGCDYTGWDCQSSADIFDSYATVEAALDAVKIDEYDSRKNILACLRGQVAGTIPFAIYKE